MSRLQSGKYSRTLPQKPKQKQPQDEWLGNMATTSPPHTPTQLQFISPITNVQSFQKTTYTPQKSMLSIRQETSSAAVQTSQVMNVELQQTGKSQVLGKKSLHVVQQVLSKLNDNPIEVNPYYGKNASSKLLELLRSRNKLKGFIGELEKGNSGTTGSSMSQPIKLANDVLALLLKKLEKNWEDLQVHVSDEQDDFQLVIGERALYEREEELEHLKKQLQKKEQSLKEVQSRYMQAIGNLTDALDSLSR